MSDDDRMSLDEAELWFDYWEMTGERVTAVERAAAEVLRAEYDRRGAALAERDAEIERLRATVAEVGLSWPEARHDLDTLSRALQCRCSGPDGCAAHEAMERLAVFVSEHLAPSDPDCIECGGEGAPCCDPPDMPTGEAFMRKYSDPDLMSEDFKRGMSIGTWPFADPPAFLGDTPPGLGDMRIVPAEQTESEGADGG